MTRSVFISFYVIAITIHATVQLACGLNEHEEKCPANCPSDHCPGYERQDRACPKPDLCGAAECKCNFNMRRDADMTCIPTEKCPPFYCGRPNEEYVACPSVCPSDDCSDATPDGRCPMPFGAVMLFVVECSPKCRCIKGYWRNNGDCVPYNQCPQFN